ncbi:hypothetical protein POM88_016422 [Heracleum sosnowskyi]|uniref:PHD-type domain-containing protein n=1 Tax=Heracleum sosnowskyi TaxID=360622 RepID=A0AAD8INJ3_9APIA|nr:hypothetical protein POM88_016422 [Heracleum sosnowskyi]
MDRTKLIAKISEAGSVGVSLQADRREKNQRRRFGRTRRSNQASAPEYSNLENYPLPGTPESLSGEDGVKELYQKRPSATAGVSFKGRVDSEPEPADSDDEFQICQICNSEAERKKLLQCSCCKQLMHPACSVLSVTGSVSADWSCVSCKEKTEEYLQQRRVYLAQKLERYDEATERKSHILNPLEDVIVQLGGPYKVHEITGRRHRLVRASNGIAVRYEPRSTKDVTMEMVKINEKQSFMDGEKLVAIISEAGSAGVSLQADRRAINQFGRTHRSNLASAPEYRLLFGNLGGECRFASIIAKRLESLGALTQGDRRAGPSLRAYNYESPYAKRALAELYNGIVIQVVGKIQMDFIVKGKAALVSVGLVKDDTNVGILRQKLHGYSLRYRIRFLKIIGPPKNVHIDHLSGASTFLFTRHWIEVQVSTNRGENGRGEGTIFWHLKGKCLF